MNYLCRLKDKITIISIVQYYFFWPHFHVGQWNKVFICFKRFSVNFLTERTEQSMNLKTASRCDDDSCCHRFGCGMWIGVTVVSLVILICWVATFHTKTPLRLFFVPCCEAARILANTADIPVRFPQSAWTARWLKITKTLLFFSGFFFFPRNYIY